MHNACYVNDNFVKLTVPGVNQYECDRKDLAYLRLLNEKRISARLRPVEVEQLRRVLEKFEVISYKVNSV